jgi:hypothetical protein
MVRVTSRCVQVITDIKLPLHSLPKRLQQEELGRHHLVDRGDLLCSELMLCCLLQDNADVSLARFCSCPSPCRITASYSIHRPCGSESPDIPKALSNFNLKVHTRVRRLATNNPTASHRSDTPHRMDRHRRLVVMSHRIRDHRMPTHLSHRGTMTPPRHLWANSPMRLKRGHGVKRPRTDRR